VQNVCVFSLGLALIAFPAGPRAQLKEIGEVNVQPTPEIKKLFEALAGDWDTSEKREHTRFFPSGGERKGRSHVRLAAGGAMSVMEGRSDGSAGPLSYIIVVWWDKDTNLFYGSFSQVSDYGAYGLDRWFQTFFSCFRLVGNSLPYGIKEGFPVTRPELGLASSENG
jgi:hypothetical protein